jgi:Prokaryotic glutathione synthetase, N-terminal domain
MMQALSAKGHTLSVAMQGDLFIDAGGVVKASAQPIALVPEADLHSYYWWRETGAAPDLPVSTFGAVVMRKDLPFDMEYVYSTICWNTLRLKAPKFSIIRPRFVIIRKNWRLPRWLSAIFPKSSKAISASC